MGMCTSKFTSNGTIVNDPMPGDCKADACDGAGNIVTVNDDTDKPPPDGNQCTTESCNNGVPTVTNDPVGSSCQGGKCNNMAMCVECVADGDCNVGTQPTCFQDKCISCSDGMMNGNETGVDCGGSCPTKCAGDTCAMPMDCQSGFCADTVCCDNACTGTCESCNLAGTIGVCTNIPLNGTDNAPTCDTTNVCNGAGACKLNIGEMCMAGMDCASGKCMGMPKKCTP